MLRLRLTDWKSKLSAAVHKHDGIPGLVTYNRDDNIWTASVLPFLNADYGNALNQNGAFGGTPDQVHDGLDTTLWTGSNITGGKVTFNSTDRAQEGSRSVKVDNMAVGDVCQFAKGSDVTMANYTAVTMWINVDKDWLPDDHVQFYAWDSDLGVEVGNRITLDEYFDNSAFDTWHSVTLSVGDLGIEGATTVDAFRIEQTQKQGGKAPKYYLDQIEIKQTGVPITFQTFKDKTRDFYAYGVRVAFKDNITVIEPSEFMGIAKLANGVQYRRVIENEIQFSISVREMSDFMVMGFKEYNRTTGAAETFVMYDVDFSQPIIISGDATENYISLTISDDLSSMTELSALVFGVYKDR